MLSASACLAADKFDVLPDLPDPLAYAVQPAAASTVSGAGNTSSILGGAQSVGGEPNIISCSFTGFCCFVNLSYRNFICKA